MTAEILKPPHPFPAEHDRPWVFLAGSIENGTAEDWQSQVEQQLQNEEIVLFNPRRDEWDDSWEQTISFPPFKEQVTWELEAQEQADLILFYFHPDTQAPITLLELGLAARTDKAVLVCCPDGYWRKGNVEIVCERYKIPFTHSLEDLKQQASETLATLSLFE